MYLDWGLHMAGGNFDMIENVKIYENFLKPEVFEKMRNDVLKNVTYGFNTVVAGSKDVYFNHLAWKCYQSVDKSYVKSPIFEIILPLIDNIDDIRALMRVKVNCYIGSNEAKKHKDHQDLPFSHFGGIFSLNTCDGGTWINGKKYDSIENRLIIFDAGKPHSSSNTTDSDLRLNINLNWL